MHLNPARAGLVSAQAPLEEYPWSSYPDYLRQKRPSWLRVDRVLGEHGVQTNAHAGRLEFAECVEAIRRDPEAQAEDRNLLRSWRVGSEEFIARLLDRLEGTTSEHHLAAVRHESMNQRAERIVAEELKTSGWTSERLVLEKKNHPFKVTTARRLRAETTMTLARISKRLSMGRWTYVSSLLRQQ